MANLLITKKFLRNFRVIWISAPSGAKKATGMVGKCNGLLQRILKNTEAGKLGPVELQECVFNMNLRIIEHLEFSPLEIEKGYQPNGTLEAKLPSIIRTNAVTAVLETDLLTVLERNPDHHEDVFKFMARREGLKFKTLEKSNWQKMLQKERRDEDVRRRINNKPRDPVMHYNHRKAKKKLAAAFKEFL
ncbi:hypothetical protein Golomagni_03729 [Golovinomyces magnicellulatus]|nr:hypothetical protein Golomagni_03729 [Golovinomyces magnicellulatus]